MHKTDSENFQLHMQTLAKPITVVLADDHEVFRLGLKNILLCETDPELQIVGEAANGVQLVEQVKRTRPDIVITDITMPLMNGIQACRVIRSNYPKTKILALALSDEADFVMNMAMAGANGYIVKNTTGKEIIEGIKAISNGGSYYCQNVSEHFYGKLSKQIAVAPNHPVRFTEQEIIVIKHICMQQTTSEIALNLGLSKRTVEDYRQHILEKTCAKNMVGIALYALKYDIVRVSDLSSFSSHN